MTFLLLLLLTTLPVVIGVPLACISAEPLLKLSSYVWRPATSIQNLFRRNPRRTVYWATTAILVCSEIFLAFQSREYLEYKARSYYRSCGLDIGFTYILSGYLVLLPALACQMVASYRSITPVARLDRIVKSLPWAVGIAMVVTVEIFEAPIIQFAVLLPWLLFSG